MKQPKTFLLAVGDGEMSLTCERCGATVTLLVGSYTTKERDRFWITILRRCELHKTEQLGSAKHAKAIGGRSNTGTAVSTTDIDKHLGTVPPLARR